MADKAAAPKSITKSETYQQLATKTELTRKQIASVFDSLALLIKQELGKKGPGVFTVPGLLKLRRIHKPATKARKGINRFTGLEQTFKAKPAHSVVRARPLKALKEMVK
jgi:nucleoid DNA-binding protein